MNIKQIILVALAALALGLASVGVAAPSLAGGHGTSGDFQAGSKPGVVSGANEATAGAKPGLLSGSDSASLSDEREDAPRFSVDGGMSGGVLGK